MRRPRGTSSKIFESTVHKWMANSSPVYDWFQERLEIQDIADDVTSKYVPPHVNIFYCLGGITLVFFFDSIRDWIRDDLLLQTYSN